MEPKRVDPITGALNFLSALSKGPPDRTNAITDKLPSGTLVDTCLTTDTGLWETGIKRPSIERIWVIVEQYKDGVAAEIGHQKWLKLIQENPALPLKDIDLWSLGI